MRKFVTQVFYGIKLNVIPSHLRQSQFRYVTTLESPDVSDIFAYGNLRASNIRGLIGGQLHIPARSNLHTLALIKNPKLESLRIECPLVKLKLSKPILIKHAPQTLTHLRIRFCKTANLHLIPPTITNLRINFDHTMYLEGTLPPSVKKLTLSGRLKSSSIGLANVEYLKLTSDFELEWNLRLLSINNLKVFINQTLANREYLLHPLTPIEVIALKWNVTKDWSLKQLNVIPYRLVILKGGDYDARYAPYELPKNINSLQLDTVWPQPISHHVKSISVLKQRGEYKTFTRGFWTRSLLWFLEFCFFYKWAYWTFFDHHK